MTQQSDTQERLKQIRERFATSPATWEDIGFLLALIDSQAELAHAARTPMGVSIAESAATAMRDACVEKVGQILTGLMIELSQTPDSYLRGQGWNSALARANNEITPALQSLTLDNCES